MVILALATPSDKPKFKKKVKLNIQIADKLATLQILALEKALRKLRLECISMQSFPGILIHA